MDRVAPTFFSLGILARDATNYCPNHGHSATCNTSITEKNADHVYYGNGQTKELRSARVSQGIDLRTEVVNTLSGVILLSALMAARLYVASPA